MSRQKRDIAGHRDIGQGDKNTSPSCRGFRPQSITPIPRLSLVLFWSVENPNQKPPSLREKRSMAFPRRVAAAPPLPQAGGHPTSHRSPPAARQGPRGRAGRNHCARGSNAAPGRPSSSCPRAPLERPRHTSRWRVRRCASGRGPPPAGRPASPSGCTRQGRKPRASPSGSTHGQVPSGLR